MFTFFFAVIVTGVVDDARGRFRLAAENLAELDIVRAAFLAAREARTSGPAAPAAARTAAHASGLKPGKTVGASLDCGVFEGVDADRWWAMCRAGNQNARDEDGILPDDIPSLVLSYEGTPTN